jgi:hypothetical protein
MNDFAKAAAEMAATAKCMEVVAPLDQPSRERVAMGLVIMILQQSSSPETKASIDELVKTTMAKVRGR